MTACRINSIIGVIGLSVLTLVGCGQSNTTGANNSVATSSNKTVSTQENSKSSDNSTNESPSMSWIIITSPKPDQRVEAGLKLEISGRLSRVQREPSIHVMLFQSQGTHDNNGVVLVKANIPVQGSGAFRERNLNGPTIFRIKRQLFYISI